MEIDPSIKGAIAGMDETLLGDPKMPKVALVHDLGGNNDGKIGPHGLESGAVDVLISDTESPIYHAKPTRRFVCVDGRGEVEGHDFAPAPEGYVDPQTAGSLVISLTSARMMTTDSPAPVSRTVAISTHDIVSSGFESVMHGDEHAGKAGCGANKNQRAVLARTAENVDIVAPVVWKLAEATRLTSMVEIVDGVEQPLINQDDLVNVITQGGKNAAKGELWDATPEEVVDIAVQNGAQYVVLAGNHTEAILAVTTADVDVFDNRKFAEEHEHPETGEEIEAFAAALGVVQSAIFEIVEKLGGTKREAALLCLAEMCVNSGTAKILKNDDLLAAVFA